MKKWTLALAALLVATVLPVSAAAEEEVLNGTPELDGVRDAIYEESACIALENFGFYTNGSTDADPAVVDGTKAWYLWDEDYLYMFVEVKDNTTSAYDESVDYTSWSSNDNVESHVWYGEEASGDQGYFHVNCLGQGITSGSTLENASLKAVGVQTDDGYNVEIAIDLSDTDMVLEAGAYFTWCLQYNNRIPEDEACVASGYQSSSDGTLLLLSADKVTVETEPETEPEPETVADVEVVETTAPVTFDAGIAAAAALIAAAGAAIASKKRK